MVFANLTVAEIETVIRTWKEEYESIGGHKDITYVQIFENKGSVMGPSSPHPHCQIWANHTIPTIPQREQDHQLKYYKIHKTPLLIRYQSAEHSKQERIIFETNEFSVLIPFWATWPYETIVLPNEHLRSLSDFEARDIEHLAHALFTLTRTYDKLFHVSFPYSMGIHQAPTDGNIHDEWQFHMHFYPPLLRSATVKKHFVGYEMLAEAQRDITPETAAETLRKLI